MKLIILLIALFFTSGARADTWSPIESQHFLIMFTGSEGIARDIQQMAEEFYPRVTNDMGYSPGREITIWFFKSKKDFHKSASAPIQDWAAGYAYPMQARIVIHDPESLGDKRLNLYHLVKHEITHVIFGLYMGNNLGNIPRWFNEGLAMYESEEWSYGHYWTMLVGVLSDSIIPFDKLDFSAGESQARMAYTQSNSIIAFMVERYSVNSLKECIRLLSEGKSIDEALENSIGFDSFWLEKKWVKSLKKRYRWISFLSDWSILWIIAVALVMLAYLRRKIRNRQTLRQWKEEEIWEEFDEYEDDKSEEPGIYN